MGVIGKQTHRALTTAELGEADIASLQKERNWYRDKVRRAHEAIRFPKPLSRQADISRALQEQERPRYEELMRQMPTRKELKSYEREDYIRDIETMASYLASPLTNRSRFIDAKKNIDDERNDPESFEYVVLGEREEVSIEEAIGLMLAAEERDLADYKRHEKGSPERYLIIQEWEEQYAKGLSKKERSEAWKERGYTEEEIQHLARVRRVARERSEAKRDAEYLEAENRLLKGRIKKWNSTDRGRRSRL